LFLVFIDLQLAAFGPDRILFWLNPGVTLYARIIKHAAGEYFRGDIENRVDECDCQYQVHFFLHTQAWNRPQARMPNGAMKKLIVMKSSSLSAKMRDQANPIPIVIQIDFISVSIVFFWLVVSNNG
jgi:hypothetical protein